MKAPQIKDRFGLVYGILMILGVGTLLPLNVFLTEKEFFDIRLHVQPADPLVADNFLSLFGLVFNAANLLAVCGVICLQQSLSLRTQIVNPLVVIFIVLASTAALALRLDLSGASVAYYSLPALAVLGMCMAVLQGGVLNLASLFPPIYIQGFVVGAGMSGCATSLLSLLSQLASAPDAAGGERGPADVAPAAAVYFGAAAAITALCIAAFSMLTRLRYSQAKLAPYLASRAAAAAAAADRDLLERLLPAGGGAGPAALPPGKDPDALPSWAAASTRTTTLVGSSGTDYYHSSGAAAEQGAAGPGMMPSEAARLARDYYLSQTGAAGRSVAGPGGAGGGSSGAPPGLREAAAADAALASGALVPGGAAARRGSMAFVIYAVSIVLTMGCSLAIWPGVTAFICSVSNPARTSPCAPLGGGPQPRLTGDLFVPLTFVVFGLGDLTGRVASSMGPWGRRPPHPAAMLAYAIARLGLGAAILVCNVVTPTPWLLPTLLNNDAYPLALIAALGLTQGHLLSTACMHAPALVPPGKEGDFGPVTGFAITAGSLLGSGALFGIMQRFTTH